MLLPALQVPNPQRLVAAPRGVGFGVCPGFMDSGWNVEEEWDTAGFA